MANKTKRQGHKQSMKPVTPPAEKGKTQNDKADPVKGDLAEVSVGRDFDSAAQGSVFLGSDGVTYETRYRIDQRQPHWELNRAAIGGECSPCCLEENRKPLGSAIWWFVTSESFLLVLHVVVITMGAVKGTLVLEANAKNLHLALSSIETFFTLLNLVLRGAAAWGRFQDSLKSPRRVACLRDDVHDAATAELRVWLTALLAFCGILVCVVITCFIVFFLLASLAWTILSNNTCLVLMMVTSHLLQSRQRDATWRVTADRQRAVLCEAVLLMDESVRAHRDGLWPAHWQRLRQFVGALLATPGFQQPEYISLGDRKAGPNGDVGTTTAIENFV